MAISRYDHRGVRLLEEGACEPQYVRDWIRLREDPRMCADSNHARQHLRSDPIRGRPVNDAIEPASVASVIGAIRAKRVDENVNVGQDQARSSIRSSMAALLSRSTPGSVPPRARDTGNRTGCFCSRGSGLRSTSSRPCSRSAVSVMPRRAASLRARSRSASLSRTVVRICLSMESICLYVKGRLPGHHFVQLRVSRRWSPTDDRAHTAPQAELLRSPRSSLTTQASCSICARP